jgi:hypothetical protein
MPTTTPNFGWSVPVSTDLVKDGATAIELLGDSIDASLVDLKGGTTGQVLAKASGTDMDFSWVAVDPLTILDAKGDLISATAADTPARLAVGANGTILTADSAETTGLKWAAPASAGKVLQVVTGTYSTQTVVAATSYGDSGLSLSITPSAATSKVMVLITQNVGASRSGDGIGYDLNLVRTSTQIWEGPARVAAASEIQVPTSILYLDSPNTTSATTYKTQIRCTITGSSSSSFAQLNSSTSMITLMEIGA